MKRDSVALYNQKKIKTLYSKYGYLGYDKIGKNIQKNFGLQYNTLIMTFCFNKNA